MLVTAFPLHEFSSQVDTSSFCPTVFIVRGPWQRSRRSCRQSSKKEDARSRLPLSTLHLMLIVGSPSLILVLFLRRPAIAALTMQRYSTPATTLPPYDDGCGGGLTAAAAFADDANPPPASSGTTGEGGTLDGTLGRPPATLASSSQSSPLPPSPPNLRTKTTTTMATTTTTSPPRRR